MIRQLFGRLIGRSAGAAPDAEARPFVRWWWFAGPIDPQVVERQLRWARDNGFGGVEVAWIYPLRGAEGAAAARWLGPEWAAQAAHAKRTAEALGLGCDFTFGSLWPFCGSGVAVEDSHHDFDGPTGHAIRGTWEDAHGAGPALVLDHLDRDALARYAARVGAALAPALALGRPSALFCDSWEVPTWRMWSPRLWDRFEARFGYDLRPLADQVGTIDGDEHLRYDYRAFIADAVLDEFYRPFAAECRRLGATSRVQCHGAPTDLLAAYAAVDIPETEVLLFPAPFARIAASAAALAGRAVVTCEAFTCLYGFPAVHMKEEDPADLRLLADAAIAHGVNHVVWHGMPYNPPGGPNAFFATSHVGPDGGLARAIPALNADLAAVCARMRRGRTYAKLAVYLPIEDNRMRDRLPLSMRTPAARYYWELRQEVVPEEAEPFHPLWISEPFLADATWDGSRLRAGAAEFEALLVGVQWLDAGSLAAIHRLAEAGLPVALTRRPERPGRGEDAGYEARLDALMALPNVRSDLADLALVPLVEGADLPPYWARVDGDVLTLFFAHPGAWDVRYPMTRGQARSLPAARRAVVIRHLGASYPVTLRFPPARSLLLEVRGGKLRPVRPGRGGRPRPPGRRANRDG